ncbi:SitI3 family protein [Actinoplanes sp. RD1]|uniref:SitI3 family protein n=1 Tax=Actinoplanes sp. RD1 TaxID=3064538 RepID=UPI0027408C7F|nr:SitI3 family protein [Actinoplanes sp. RD1]
MALEYKLTLAGDIPLDQVGARAFPDADERPSGRWRSADHKERYGYDVSVLGGRNGYLELLTDDGSWEWEPEACVRLVFNLDKFAEDFRRPVTGMLTVVRRVLDTGPEDAVLDFNGDVMLFIRRDGVLTKHRRETWWKAYPSGDQLIPG